MKRLFYLLFFTLIIFGCSKDELEYQNDFDKSYNIWLQFNKNNKSYSYTSQTSSWVGITSQTTITVENNQIIKRTFKYFRIGSKTIPESGWTKSLAIEALKEIGYTDETIQSAFGDEIIDKLQWQENKENLGKHGNPNQLMTLEQIYDKTRHKWIIKRPEAKIYFETKNNGLISLVGYTPNGCVDDCFIGIDIIKIEKLED